LKTHEIQDEIKVKSIYQLNLRWCSFYVLLRMEIQKSIGEHCF